VHGCLDELLTLVSRCRYAAGDRLILVGDLVAKGPDSLGVVAWARESGAEAVLGNHEEHVLRARRGMPVKPKHQRLAEAFGAEDAAWLEARPLFLPAGELEGKPLVVVHAGLMPGVAIAGAAAGPPPEPAQRDGRRCPVESDRRRALGVALVRPGADRVRPRLVARPATVPLGPWSRHRLRLRPAIDGAHPAGGAAGLCQRPSRLRVAIVAIGRAERRLIEGSFLN